MFSESTYDLKSFNLLSTSVFKLVISLLISFLNISLVAINSVFALSRVISTSVNLSFIVLSSSDLTVSNLLLRIVSVAVL